LHERLLDRDEIELKLAEEDMDKLTLKGREAAQMKPFKEHCYHLYLQNRREVENAVFEHFSKLDRAQFAFSYHKEFPRERSAAKAFTGARAHQNLTALLRQGSRFAGSEDFDTFAVQTRETKYEWDDDDEVDLDNFDADRHRKGLKRGHGDKHRKRLELEAQWAEEDRKEAEIGGLVRFEIEYWKEFDRASDILFAEVKRQKAVRGVRHLGLDRVQSVIEVLKQPEHRLQQLIILRVIKYAILTETVFCTDEYIKEHREDSRVYDSDGEEIYNPQLKAKRKKLLKHRKVNRELAERMKNPAFEYPDLPPGLGGPDAEEWAEKKRADAEAVIQKKFKKGLRIFGLRRKKEKKKRGKETKNEDEEKDEEEKDAGDVEMGYVPDWQRAWGTGPVPYPHLEDRETSTDRRFKEWCK